MKSLKSLISKEVPTDFNQNRGKSLFNPNFPELNQLKDIVKSQGSIFFQPFDIESLRVSPLKLKVHPAASFRMQPCREFVNHKVILLESLSVRVPFSHPSHPAQNIIADGLTRVNLSSVICSLRTLHLTFSG